MIKSQHKKLVSRRPSGVHWFLRIPAGLIGAGLAFVVVAAIRDPGFGGGGIRIIIPAAALASFMLIAMAVNIRTATLTADELRIRVRPFPLHPGLTLGREDFRLCYARTIRTVDEGQVVEVLHTAGIESGRNGHQIDIYGPLDNREDALRGLEWIARIVNHEGVRWPIPVERSHPANANYSHRGPVVVYGALFILLVFAGAAWEIYATTTGSIRYTGPRFW